VRTPPQTRAVRTQTLPPPDHKIKVVLSVNGPNSVSGSTVLSKIEKYHNTTQKEAILILGKSILASVTDQTICNDEATLDTVYELVGIGAQHSVGSLFEVSNVDDDDDDDTYTLIDD